MTQTSNPAAGIIEVGQLLVTNPPVDPTNVVRLMDLLSLISSSSSQGIAESEWFVGLDTSQALDRTAIYVLPSGIPKTATSVTGGDTVVAVKCDGKLYTEGKYIKGFSTNLIPGASYWLTSTGIFGTSPTEVPGEWSVRVGIAVNATTLKISLENMGGN